MMSRRPLPIGEDDFAQLHREVKLAYVDKTEHIAALVDCHSPRFVSPHLFLARPRRFGKTLLISTLEALFQGQQAVFRDTWIHDRWNWTQSYPVIRLDMGQFRDVHDTATFRGQLQQYLASLQTGQPLSALAEGASMREPRQQLHDLIRIHARTQPVVVLVDEYDTPLTANLDPNHAAVLPAMLDMLRGFYGVLKDNARHIHRTFITGITRFARTGLFSGANHLTDISFDPDFSDLLGFTESDLWAETGVLYPYLVRGACNLQWSRDQLQKALAAHYHGYRFARSGTVVYNPWSLLGCLQQLHNPRRADDLREAGFPNLWAESGHPRLLFPLLQKARPAAQTLLCQAPDEVERLNYDIARPQAVVLMYQTGYLTRRVTRDPQGRRTDCLDFPNSEVAMTFLAALTDWVVETTTADLLHNRDGLRALDEAVRHPSPHDLALCLNRQLQAMPYPLHGPADLSPVPHVQAPWRNLRDYEVHYQALFSNWLNLLESVVYVETPARHLGRGNILVDCRSHLLVLELQVNGDAETAVRQALYRQYGLAMVRKGQAIMVMGLNIDTHQRSITACACWELGVFDVATGHWAHEPFELPLQQVHSMRDTERMHLPFSEGLTRYAM